MLSFAALAVLGLLLDLRRLGRSRPEGAPPTADDMRGALYSDGSGLFSMTAPRGWRVVRRPPDTAYNVVFEGPFGMDICVQAVEKEAPSLGAILVDIKKMERKLDAHLHIESIVWNGRPAIRRTAQLFRNKVYAVDFVGERSAHHIQFAAPPGMFDRYLPAITNLLAAYEPLK